MDTAFLATLAEALKPGKRKCPFKDESPSEEIRATSCGTVSEKEQPFLYLAAELIKAGHLDEGDALLKVTLAKIAQRLTSGELTMTPPKLHFCKDWEIWISYGE